MSIQRNLNAKWCGIVMIIRPDVSKLPQGHGTPLARVVSKRDLELDGKRAIAEWLPLPMFDRYFQAGDGDAVEVYAELLPMPGRLPHLEFYEKASKREFFLQEPTITLPPESVSRHRALSAINPPAQSGISP